MTLALALAGLAGLMFSGLWVWAALRRSLWPVGGSPWAHLCALLAIGCSVLWCFGVAALVAWPQWLIDEAVAWLDALRGLSWVGLLLLLLGGEVRRGWPPFAWISGGIALAATLGLGSVAMGTWSRQDQVVVYAASGLTLALVGLVLIEQVYRNAANDRRWNAKPLCLGLVVMFGFDLYLFTQTLLLRQPDPQATLLRPMVAALGVPLLAVGLGRGAALMASLHMSRSLVFHSATLLLSGCFLLAVAAIGYWVRYTGGEWGATVQVLLSVLALMLVAVVVLSGAVRAKLRVWISKSFFQYRYDYRAEWLRFTAALTPRGGPEGLGESVVRSLAGMVESPAGGLWLRRGDETQLVQVAHWNFERSGLGLPIEGCLQDLATRAWIADLNEWRSEVRPNGVQPADWLMADQAAWLLIPLVVGEQLHGAVVLAQPRTPIGLDWEVRDLLKTASSQAAGTLALLEASEQLMEARKFEAFNRMSAFVVHDLKNIVTQLSLMIKNAERHGDNPEFRRDMDETVRHALEKMRQLMLQLREGARPAGVSSGVSLNAIAQRLQTSVKQRGRELRLRLREGVETRGIEERVERVIGHAVQNAFDASAEDQPVTLTLDVVGSYARVQVKDDGVGMSPEFVQERLFKPFQSTKTHGMGIGAFESLQYVRELGGKMEVDSAPQQGTRITFLLPLFHSHSPG